MPPQVFPGLLAPGGRYPLVFGDSLAVLEVVTALLPDAVVLVGSSFPRDSSYAAVCRDLHRVKQCMELGRAVVLCQHPNLYESLYDAARTSPLNADEVFPGYERVMRPHLDLDFIREHAAMVRGGQGSRL